MKSQQIIACAFLGWCLFGCSSDERSSAQHFLDTYSHEWTRLQYAANLADWEANIRIVPGDTSAISGSRAANEALAAFTGRSETIETCREFLENSDRLTDLQVRQLNAMLYQAATRPEIQAAAVKERIALEAQQTAILFGFDFQVDGDQTSTSAIDALLKSQTDLSKRLAGWQASKAVGSALKPGLEHLRRLRNETVRALGYDDFFAYQVSQYGMTSAEMLSLTRHINSAIRPLYQEIHTYMRHQLAAKYGEPVPEMIPAHWLPDRWGQDWSSGVAISGHDLNGALAERGSEWIIEQAEQFYISLGFDPLPERFYRDSSLYPPPPRAAFKKNSQASAWHMDLDSDVRALMSVEATPDWYETVHHELGHIYTFLSYATDQVPPLLRKGANRAYHEAIGTLLGFAAMQPGFLAEAGLISKDGPLTKMQILLKQALNYVVFVPWSAGVMTEFEFELYSRSLPSASWNERWWQLKERHQGIKAPGIRGDEDCDPATKTHINNDPAQYYDYAISMLLMFQLHDHIATKILGQDLRDANYYGENKVGDFLKSILNLGATKDWQDVHMETTGAALSADAMLAYFEPLLRWLKEQNQGRYHTLQNNSES